MVGIHRSPCVASLYTLGTPTILFPADVPAMGATSVHNAG